MFTSFDLAPLFLFHDGDVVIALENGPATGVAAAACVEEAGSRDHQNCEGEKYRLLHGSKIRKLFICPAEEDVVFELYKRQFELFCLAFDIGELQIKDIEGPFHALDNAKIVGMPQSGFTQVVMKLVEGVFRKELFMGIKKIEAVRHIPVWIPARISHHFTEAFIMALFGQGHQFVQFRPALVLQNDLLLGGKLGLSRKGYSYKQEGNNKSLSHRN